MIDQWAPNIKKFFEDPMVKAQLVLPDGGIYATPASEMAPWLQTATHLFVNRTWLDKLGLSLPRTTEEYKAVLKAVKENDMDGDGKNNEIPLTLAGVSNFTSLLGSFGIACETDYIFIRNGKVDYAVATDNFKKALEYFHSLYADGLIDSESFSQNTSQLRAKAKTGQVFSFNQFVASSTVGNELNDQYQYLLPLIGPDGHQEFSQRVNTPVIGLVISAKTKYPEAILRWVDYLNSDYRVMLEANGGLESQGVWEDRGEGKYFYNSNKTPEGISWAEWISNTGWFNSAPVFQSEDFVTRYRVLDGDAITQGALKCTLEHLEYKLDEVLPSVMVEPEISTEVSQIFSDLDTLTRDFIAKSIIYGFSDNDWNTFQNNLGKAQYKRYVELKQMIYDKIKN